MTGLTIISKEKARFIAEQYDEMYDCTSGDFPYTSDTVYFAYENVRDNEASENDIVILLKAECII